MGALNECSPNSILALSNMLNDLMVHLTVVIFTVNTTFRLVNSVRERFPLMFFTYELGMIFSARVHESNGPFECNCMYNL